MSYSPVFSTGFLYYGPQTPNQHYEVPSGFTAVLRDVSCYTEVGGVDLGVAVRLSSEAPFVNVIALGVVGVNTSNHWEGRIVIPSGGFIDLNVVNLGANDTAYVGGYLLRNTIS